MSLKQEIEAYEKYIGERVNWLERMGDMAKKPKPEATENVKVTGIKPDGKEVDIDTTK